MKKLNISFPGTEIIFFWNLCCGKRHQITYHLMKLRTQKVRHFWHFSASSLEDFASPQRVREPKVRDHWSRWNNPATKDVCITWKTVTPYSNCRTQPLLKSSASPSWLPNT
jgi:hypothetical protein